MVGTDDADSNGSNRCFIGMVSTTGTLQDRSYLIHYHGFLLRNTRYCCGRLLHDRAGRARSIGLCRFALYILPHRQYFLSIAPADDRRMVAKTHGHLDIVDLCPTPLQRHPGSDCALAYMEHAGSRGER